jgi:hypothetical protein
MNEVDRYYPIDDKLKLYPLRQVGYIMRITANFGLAKAGDRDAESRLCNRLGSLRRSIEFSDMSPNLQEAVKDTVEWLRSVGRKVDFKHNDPAMWITTRSGGPRF